MKAIIINGSPRKNGMTARVAERILATMGKKEGYDAEIVHLSDIGLSNCIGCGTCFKKGGCILKDGGDNLSRRIGEADAIVFASPVYASNVTSTMKTFIDRCHIILEQLLFNKSFFSVVTYENAGHSDALRVLKQLGSFSGGIDLGSAAFKVGRDGRIENEEKKFLALDRKIDSFMRKTEGKEKIPLFQALRRGAIRSIGIKPFIMNNERHKAVEAIWREKGWL